MSTCTRPSCRKKATYELTLARLGGPGAPASRIQQWQLCNDHRDAVQLAITDAAWGLKVTVEGPSAVDPGKSAPPLPSFTQADLDREDRDLRDRVAQSATSNEEPKDATPARLVPNRGRAVAQPPV